MGTMKDQLREYDSVGEFLDTATSKPSPLQMNQRASRTKDGEWSGVDFNSAVKLLREGWSEGYQKIKELTDKVGEIVGAKVVQDVSYYDVSGAYVDVGRFLDGEPECMVEYKPDKEMGTKNVTVVSSMSFSADVDPDEIIKNGVVAACIVDGLEIANSG